MLEIRELRGGKDEGFGGMYLFLYLDNNFGGKDLKGSDLNNLILKVC